MASSFHHLLPRIEAIPAHKMCCSCLDRSPVRGTCLERSAFSEMFCRWEGPGVCPQHCCASGSNGYRCVASSLAEACWRSQDQVRLYQHAAWLLFAVETCAATRTERFQRARLYAGLISRQ